MRYVTPSPLPSAGGVTVIRRSVTAMHGKIRVSVWVHHANFAIIVVRFIQCATVSWRRLPYRRLRDVFFSSAAGAPLVRPRRFRLFVGIRVSVDWDKQGERQTPVRLCTQGVRGGVFLVRPRASGRGVMWRLVGGRLSFTRLC